MLGGSVLATLLKVSHYLAGSVTKKNDPKQKIISWDIDDGDQILEKEEDVVMNSDNEYFSDTDSDASTIEYDGYQPYYSQREKNSKKTSLVDERLAKYFTGASMWKDSDIDIFLYDLTPEQAEQKIEYLYNLFKKNLKDLSPNKYCDIKSVSIEEKGSYRAWRPTREYLESGPVHKYDDPEDIMIIRTEHAITFRMNHPIRSIQIILRLYKSPAEILIGFDLASCSIGFDGHEVYCLPRTRKALLTRCNLVDPDRQSLSYETRLVKYALRGK